MRKTLFIPFVFICIIASAQRNTVIYEQFGDTEEFSKLTLYADSTFGDQYSAKPVYNSDRCYTDTWGNYRKPANSLSNILAFPALN